MKLRSFSPAAVVLAAGVVLFSGCTWFTDPPSSNLPSAPGGAPNTAAPVGGANGQPLYVVKVDFTPLYRTGPAQPTGPDQSVAKDTLVTMLKKGFGYSRVQLESGLDGYVATDDLAPASAARVAAAAPKTPADSANTENNSAIVEHYTVDKARQSADLSNSNANAEGNPDLPEPRLEPEPTPVIKPEFRY